MNQLIGVAAAGLAAALLFFGAQKFLLRRFRKDVGWMRETCLRFSPVPVSAEGRVLALYGGFVVLLFLLLWMAPHPIMAIVLWLGSFALPRMIVNSLWKRRRQQVDQQIPAAVASMANSLRSGITLVQAMERLAENAPEPIRTDFRVMVNRYSVGANLEDTIRQTKERLKLANFNLFASALMINREMGGDISDTLFRISASLDRLQQMRKTIEAHTSEGRTNIKILSAAPIVLLLMLSTVDSEGVSMLFTTVQGWAILTVAALLIGAGIYFAAWITHSEI